jgi:hypothetical protein
LACPARFERATYALEEFVVIGESLCFNNLEHKKRCCAINCAMGFIGKTDILYINKQATQ